MFTKVNRYTRGGKNGKQLKCPKCQSVRTIYHFSWSGLTCPECKESIDKYDWLVESKGSWLNCPYSEGQGRPSGWNQDCQTWLHYCKADR